MTTVSFFVQDERSGKRTRIVWQPLDEKLSDALARAGVPRLAAHTAELSFVRTLVRSGKTIEDIE